MIVYFQNELCTNPMRPILKIACENDDFIDKNRFHPHLRKKCNEDQIDFYNTITPEVYHKKIVTQIHNTMDTKQLLKKVMSQSMTPYLKSNNS